MQTMIVIYAVCCAFPKNTLTFFGNLKITYDGELKSMCSY